MKKLKYLFLAMFSIVCSATFMACSSSDDDGQESPTVKKATFVYSFSINEEILSVADITIRYIGTDGIEQKETLASTTWTKTITADKFNVSSGVYITMKLKSDAELTNETYNVSSAFNYSAKATENGETVDGYTSTGSSTSITVKADKLGEYLQKKTFTGSLKVNDSGKVETTTLSWQE